MRLTSRSPTAESTTLRIPSVVYDDLRHTGCERVESVVPKYCT